ncbi:hypothetical protein LMG22037_03974 [Paraburkholderia phenoliruptrix]|uniref:Uncharacterized protein n=2 Tax=Paraburkholderia phenoliruptrix TaxID=252970 RepID=A0A6J5BMF2_9BURK|nr:hypothetical protein LMG22037_03974 [Paraburkholderia phenoliruptrix]
MHGVAVLRQALLLAQSSAAMSQPVNNASDDMPMTRRRINATI